MLNWKLKYSYVALQKTALLNAVCNLIYKQSHNESTLLLL